jgi:hypothetical protein
MAYSDNVIIEAPGDERIHREEMKDLLSGRGAYETNAAKARKRMVKRQQSKRKSVSGQGYEDIIQNLRGERHSPARKK